MKILSPKVNLLLASIYYQLFQLLILLLKNKIFLSFKIVLFLTDPFKLEIIFYNFNKRMYFNFIYESKSISFRKNIFMDFHKSITFSEIDLIKKKNLCENHWKILFMCNFLFKLIFTQIKIDQNFRIVNWFVFLKNELIEKFSKWRIFKRSWF